MTSERDYEFKNYCNDTERSASGDVRVLLYRTWTTEQSNPLDFCKPLVGRTYSEPSVHREGFLVRSTGQVSDAFLVFFGGGVLIRFLLGVVLIACVVSYGHDIKKFIVDSGMRDMIVIYLSTW